MTRYQQSASCFKNESQLPAFPMIKKLKPVVILIIFVNFISLIIYILYAFSKEKTSCLQGNEHNTSTFVVQIQLYSLHWIKKIIYYVPRSRIGFFSQIEDSVVTRVLAFHHILYFFNRIPVVRIHSIRWKGHGCHSGGYTVQV